MFHQGVTSHHLPSPILNTSSVPPLCFIDGQCLCISESLERLHWAGKRHKRWPGTHKAPFLSLSYVQTIKNSGGSEKLPIIKLLGKELGHHNGVSIPPISTLPPDDSSVQHQVCGFSPFFPPFFSSAVDLSFLLKIRGRSNGHRTDFDSQTSMYINPPWQHQYITFPNILPRTWSWNY